MEELQRRVEQLEKRLETLMRAVRDGQLQTIRAIEKDLGLAKS